MQLHSSSLLSRLTRTLPIRRCTLPALCARSSDLIPAPSRPRLLTFLRPALSVHDLRSHPARATLSAPSVRLSAHPADWCASPRTVLFAPPRTGAPPWPVAVCVPPQPVIWTTPPQEMRSGLDYFTITLPAILGSIIIDVHISSIMEFLKSEIFDRFRAFRPFGDTVPHRCLTDAYCMQTDLSVGPRIRHTGDAPVRLQASPRLRRRRRRWSIYAGASSKSCMVRTLCLAFKNSFAFLSKES
jgi:hypothetical protein